MQLEEASSDHSAHREAQRLTQIDQEEAPATTAIVREHDRPVGGADMNERICNRCKNPLTRGQKKFCSHACANRTAMERKSQKARETPWAPCEIDQCGKPGRSRTARVCPMHYHRQYRNGTYKRKQVEPKWVDVSGRKFGTLTATSRTADGRWHCVCTCGETRTASLGELNRTGDANTCGVAGKHLGDEPGYRAAHARVKRVHGPASRHECVECGGRAAHWSYDHEDPDERYALGYSRNPVAYSAKTEHYQARCVPCHKRYDLERAHATPARFLSAA